MRADELRAIEALTPSLPGRAGELLFRLVARAGDDRVVEASKRDLAVACSCSPDSIRRALRALEAAGVTHRVQQLSDGVRVRIADPRLFGWTPNDANDGEWCREASETTARGCASVHTPPAEGAQPCAPSGARVRSSAHPEAESVQFCAWGERRQSLHDLQKREEREREGGDTPAQAQNRAAALSRVRVLGWLDPVGLERVRVALAALPWRDERRPFDAVVAAIARAEGARSPGGALIRVLEREAEEPDPVPPAARRRAATRSRPLLRGGVA